MYIDRNTRNTTKRPTNPSVQSSEIKQETGNKNYYNKVQNKQSQYAYHQHGYDLNAYAQMVSAGIEPETAINHLEYFYKNLFRIEKAEMK